MMPENVNPPNPYRPMIEDDPTQAPFAGRARAIEHFYRQMADPVQPKIAIFIGQQGAGKTALLGRLAATADETLIPVIVPGGAPLPPDETAWLAGLAQAAANALAARRHVVDAAPPEAAGRDWLRSTFLPQVWQALRRYRRLVWLVDDADALLQAVHEGHFPPDAFEFWRQLLHEHPQLGLALALDTLSESRLPALGGLAAPEALCRLSFLTPEECAAVLREPAAGLYTVSDAAVAAVHRATGGWPRLLQRYGFHLYRLWELRPTRTLISPQEVRQVTPAIHEQSDDDFKARWGRLNLNERLALTALASLVYRDPLAKIEAGDLETWLVETDYPLDSTAINAALRSLEYEEWITIASGGIAINGELLQIWLLENARLEAAPRPVSLRQTPRLVLAAVALIAIAALALILTLITTPRPASTPTAQPTVTLANP